MEHIFGRAPKGPAPPARGAVAGVKADMERAKEGFDPRNPNGVGMAWTHNFLNQKPWHPMSFKNRMRAWEAEQSKTEADRTKEKAQAEFDAEQEYLKTLSYLSAEEQQRYREVQSVSFMYTKPPGLDAALARDAERAEKKQKHSQPPQALPAPGDAAAGSGAAVAAGAGGSGSGPQPEGGGGGAGSSRGGDADPRQQRSAIVGRLREDPFTSMVAARQALLNNPRLAINVPREVGAFGGFSSEAANQQLLGDEPTTAAAGTGGDAELEFLLQLPPEQQLRALKRIARRRKRAEQERQLREAEALLQAAGYDLSAVGAVAGEAAAGAGGSGGGRHKRKKSKRSESKRSESKRSESKRSESKRSESKRSKHKDDDRSRRKSKKRRRAASPSGSSSASSPSSSSPGSS